MLAYSIDRYIRTWIHSYIHKFIPNFKNQHSPFSVCSISNDASIISQRPQFSGEEISSKKHHIASTIFRCYLSGQTWWRYMGISQHIIKFTHWQTDILSDILIFYLGKYQFNHSMWINQSINQLLTTTVTRTCLGDRRKRKRKRIQSS